MEQHPQTTISSNDILTSLSGILFFGPFIKSEHPFILGYCKVGTLNLALFLITFIVFVVDYFFPSQIFSRIITLATGAICTISAFSIFACLNEVQLFATDEPIQHKIPHKEMIIKSFIPVYNIKLRHQTANFQTPYRRLKESILWWTLFSYLTLLFGIQIGIIFIAIILIRLLLLMMNIDIIPNNLKKFLNHGFLLLPEEALGNITKKSGYVEMQESHFNTVLQYLTLVLLLRLIRRSATLEYYLFIPLLALFYLLATILFTYWKFKKFPNIPFLYEFWSFILK